MRDDGRRRSAGLQPVRKSAGAPATRATGGVVITIQRVRVRWSAASRGAPQANARRGLSRPAVLPPPLPPGDVVIHDMLADEAAGYVPHHEVLGGGVEQARNLGLWLTSTGSALIVERRPGWAAYPRQSRSTRLLRSPSRGATTE
jgi:hypothetical protein